MLFFNVSNFKRLLNHLFLLKNTVRLKSIKGKADSASLK